MSTSIAVVIPAFNAGEWIGETLRSVLNQTRPADEILVVDDGSTDDTAERASEFGEAVTVIQQENRGAPAAYNRGFDAAASEYVAMCPADDLWEAKKLEWQESVLRAEPRVDVLFARARFFGVMEGDHPHPEAEGLLERHSFFRSLYKQDLIPAPTAVVRRELHQRLGRFDERLFGEDYEFWLRALRAGATFYYDPRLMVHLRQHGRNLSLHAVEIRRLNYTVHCAYAEDLGDPRAVRRLLAHDLRALARAHFGLAQVGDARQAYRSSFRKWPSLEAAVGAGVLQVPFVGSALTWLNKRRPRHRAQA